MEAGTARVLHRGETHRLAAASRTQPEIYAGMGHNLMLDQG